MAIRIAFFDAKSYDRENFAKVNENFGFDIRMK
jgi:D-lactate dehydrogenase